MHPALVATAWPAVAIAITAAALPGQQGAGWKLSEVASSATLGGCFRHAAMTADSRTMLTVGELGDAILWDLPAGTVQKRFGASRADVSRVALHPHDPWAVVCTSPWPPQCFRLDFGSGRYQPMWLEKVHAFAFDAQGTRAAVLSSRDGGRRRLAVYAEAALRSERPLAPDFACDLEDGHGVLFHPLEPVVFVLDSSKSWRVPLDGGAIERGPDRLYGFLSDGSPITSDRTPASCAGMHWVRRTQYDLERGGIDPCSWPATNTEWREPVVAADGTVVVADDRGVLEVFGPRPGQRLTLRGHAGPVVHMCFDATNRWLASVCGGAVNVLDRTTGTTQRLEGTFGVQPAPGEAAFLLLTRNGVHRIDAATLERGAAATSLPAGWEAESFVRHWSWESRKLPWLWQPKLGQLWLGCASTDGKPQSVRLVRGVPAVLPEPTRGPDEYTGQYPIEMLATPDAGVVMAETTGPRWCGSGLQDATYWSTLSCFDQKGRLVRSCAVGPCIDWMRLSPRATRLAVGQPNGSVQLFGFRDLHSIRTVRARGAAGIVAFEFLDERSALASDGARLFVLDLTGGRTKDVPLPALPGPITRLCLSPDRSLMALACSSEVRVLRRQ